MLMLWAQICMHSSACSNSRGERRVKACLMAIMDCWIIQCHTWTRSISIRKSGQSTASWCWQRCSTAQSCHSFPKVHTYPQTEQLMLSGCYPAWAANLAVLSFVDCELSGLTYLQSPLTQFPALWRPHLSCCWRGTVCNSPEGTRSVALQTHHTQHHTFACMLAFL